MFAYNFLSLLFSAALAVVLPLYLATKFDLASVGFILAFMSIPFLVVRTLIAYYAEWFGKKPFLGLAPVASLLTTGIYATAAGMPWFVLGKMIEGIRLSLFWGVNRIVLLENSDEDNGNILKMNSGMQTIGSGAGIIIATFLAWISVEYAFLFLVAVSAITLGIAMPYREIKSYQSQAPGIMDLVKRTLGMDRKILEIGAFIGAYDSSTTIALASFALPLFLMEIAGMGYLDIGITMASYYLVAGAITYLFGKTSRPNLFIALYGLAMAIFSGIALGMLQAAFVPFAVLSLALATGLGNGMFEGMIFSCVKDSRQKNLDIAFVHFPLRISEMLTFFFAGILANSFGFPGVFLLGMGLAGVFWVGQKRN